MRKNGEKDRLSIHHNLEKHAPPKSQAAPGETAI
jgi:hypothetical protein